MNSDAVMIVRAFLHLPNLEKKKVVDKINHYFDEINEREAIRDEIEREFLELAIVEKGTECKCCGRS